MRRALNPRVIFLCAVALLVISASASAWIIYKLYESEKWVRHTFDIQLHLASIESALSQASRARTLFDNSGDPQFLKEFADSRAEALDELAEVRSLTADNSDEQRRCDELEIDIIGRMDAAARGIDLAKSGHGDVMSEAKVTSDVVEWAIRSATIIDDMDHSEDILLRQRTALMDRLFRLILTALLITFLLSIGLIWEHYRRLASELKQRTLAEERAQNLSVQILRAQDDERRRISRELHDGLGQNLTAAKMIADSLLGGPANENTINDLGAILDDSLTSIRTMSYLLHPPLLDEVGLASAAQWFIDGFSKRSGIAVNFGIRGTKRRLSPVVELTLFRILQESLTNIQRHSKSSGADVSLDFDDNRVGLKIQDHGVGIAPDRLEELGTNGNQAGFGLAGMKQRAREQGGTFKISSNERGTAITVELPVDKSPIS